MPTAVDNAPVEDDGIFDWRKDGWLKLGFNAAWADFLSRSKMDIRLAEKMIEQGADRPTIVRILAGTSPLGEDPLFDWDGFYALMAGVDDTN